MMAIWLFVYSMGQHMFFPISSTIGMELASKGRTGKRLGQLNAVTNVAKICGRLAGGFRFPLLEF